MFPLKSVHSWVLIHSKKVDDIVSVAMNIAPFIVPFWEERVSEGEGNVGPRWEPVPSSSIYLLYSSTTRAYTKSGNREKSMWGHFQGAFLPKGGILPVVYLFAYTGE